MTSIEHERAHPDKTLNIKIAIRGDFKMKFVDMWEDKGVMNATEVLRMIISEASKEFAEKKKRIRG